MQPVTVEIPEELATEMESYLARHPEYPDRHHLVREALDRLKSPPSNPQ